MNLHQAIGLVRAKYLEEERNITTGNIADKYERALEDYPVVMTTAHQLWATELAKSQ